MGDNSPILNVHEAAIGRNYTIVLRTNLDFTGHTCYFK